MWDYAILSHDGLQQLYPLNNNIKDVKRSSKNMLDLFNHVFFTIFITAKGFQDTMQCWPSDGSQQQWAIQFTAFCFSAVPVLLLYLVLDQNCSITHSVVDQHGTLVQNLYLSSAVPMLRVCCQNSVCSEPALAQSGPAQVQHCIGAGPMLTSVLGQHRYSIVYAKNQFWYKYWTRTGTLCICAEPMLV